MSKLLKMAAGLVAFATLSFGVQAAESTTTAAQLKVYYDTAETSVQGDVVNLTIVALATDGSVAKDASDGGVVVRAAVNSVNGVIDAQDANVVVNGTGGAIVGQASPTATAGIYAKTLNATNGANTQSMVNNAVTDNDYEVNAGATAGAIDEDVGGGAATASLAADMTGSAIVAVVNGIGATSIYYPTSLGLSAVTDTISVKLQQRVQTSGGGTVITQIGDDVTFNVTVNPAEWTATAFVVSDAPTERFYIETSTLDPKNGDAGTGDDAVVTAGFGKGYFSVFADGSYVGPITVTLQNPGTNASDTADVVITTNMVQTGVAEFSALVTVPEAAMKVAGLWTVEVSATINDEVVSNTVSFDSDTDDDGVSNAVVTGITVVHRPHDADDAPFQVNSRFDRVRWAKLDYTANANAPTPATPNIIVEVVDTYGNTVPTMVGAFGSGGGTDDNLDLELTITKTVSGSPVDLAVVAVDVATTVNPMTVLLTRDLSDATAVSFELVVQEVGPSVSEKATVVNTISNASSVVMKDNALVATLLFDVQQNSGDPATDGIGAIFDHGETTGNAQVVGYLHSQVYTMGGATIIARPTNLIKVGVDGGGNATVDGLAEWINGWVVSGNLTEDSVLEDGTKVMLDVYDEDHKLLFSFGAEGDLATAAYKVLKNVGASNASYTEIEDAGVIGDLVFPEVLPDGAYALISDYAAAYGQTKIVLKDDDTDPGVGVARALTGEDAVPYYTDDTDTSDADTASGAADGDLAPDIFVISYAESFDFTADTSSTYAANAVTTVWSDVEWYNVLGDLVTGTESNADGISPKLEVTSSLTAAVVKIWDTDAGPAAWSGNTDNADSLVLDSATRIDGVEFRIAYGDALIGQTDTITVKASDFFSSKTYTKTITYVVPDIRTGLVDIKVKGQTTCPVNGELLLKVWGEDVNGNKIDTLASGNELIVSSFSNGVVLLDNRRGVTRFNGQAGRVYETNEIGIDTAQNGGVRLLTFKAPSTTGTYVINFKSKDSETPAVAYPITVTATTEAGATLADGSGTDIAPVVTVTAAGGATAVDVDGTLQLSATTSNIEGTETYTWASSNGAIATIDANGLMTGVAEGSVIITATGATTAKTGQITLTVGAVAPVTGSLYCPVFLLDAANPSAFALKVNVVNTGSAAASVTLTNTAGASVGPVSVPANSSMQIDPTSTFAAEGVGGFTLSYETTGGANTIFAEAFSAITGAAPLMAPVSAEQTGNTATSLWFNDGDFTGLGAIMNTGASDATFTVTIGDESQTVAVAAGKNALFGSTKTIGNVRIAPSTGATYVATVFSFTADLGLIVPMPVRAATTSAIGGLGNAGDLLVIGAGAANTEATGYDFGSIGLSLTEVAASTDATTVTATTGSVVVDQLYLAEVGQIVTLPFGTGTKGAYFSNAAGASSKVLLVNAGSASADVVINLIGETATDSMTAVTVAANSSTLVDLTSSTVTSGAWTISTSGTVYATGYVKSGNAVVHTIGQ